MIVHWRLSEQLFLLSFCPQPQPQLHKQQQQFKKQQQQNKLVKTTSLLPGVNRSSHSPSSPQRTQQQQHQLQHQQHQQQQQPQHQQLRKTISSRFLFT